MSEEFKIAYEEGKKFVNNVISRKYLHNNEKKWTDIVSRITNEISPHVDNEIKDNIFNMINNKRGIPAGSILFGLGNNKIKCSLSNCYFIPILHDSIEGIYSALSEHARTFSYRGGVGVDITILRPKKSPVANSAKYSTGSVSFMPLFSESVNTIGQMGRRGALIITIDVRHPDIIDFIWSKSKPKEVFGIDVLTSRIPNIEGANITIKLTDDFMEAVKRNKTYDLIFPDMKHDKYDTEWDGDLNKWINKGYPIITHKTLNARSVLKQIAESAWICGDPGVSYWDNVIRWSTGSFDEKLIPFSMNPCLPDWAPILTPNGYKPITTIKNEVLVNSDIQICSDVMKTGENREVFEITLQSGLKLYATQEHKILKVDYKSYRNKSKTEFTELQKLQVGDRIKTDYSSINYTLDINEWKKGYICGWLFSDGTIHNQKKYVEFILGEKEFPQEDEFKSILSETLHVDNINFKQHAQSDKCKTCRICKNELKRDKIFKWFGSDNKNDFNLLNKSISYQIGFINAFIGADGYILNKKNRSQQVSINQSNDIGYRILSQIQLVLASLDIYSNLGISNHNKIDKRGYSFSTSWRLEITDVYSFAKHFELFHKEKNGKLKQLYNDISVVKRRRIEGLKYCQQIKEIKLIDGTYDVYDITVPSINSFVSSGCVVHNCGEQPLQRYGNCTLGAIVLHKYISDPYDTCAEFDSEQFTDDVSNMVKFLDTIIELNTHPLKKQKETDQYGRRIGVEITGIADMWAMLNMDYGSVEACEHLEDIMKLKAITEITTSLELAKQKGHAPCFKTKESRKKFLAQPYISKLFNEALLPRTKETLITEIIEHGLRNSAFATIGPQGSISIVADNCTSGCEPLYSLYYERKTRIDGMNETTKIYHFPLLKHIGDELFQLSKDKILQKYHYVEAHDLDVKDRLRVQSVLQQFTDSSISSTINLANDCTIDDIYRIYLEGYNHNLKGVTVFRDGSKSSILSTGEKNVEQNIITRQDISTHLDIMREKLRSTHRAYRYAEYWKKIKMYITVTVDEDDYPLEIFALTPYEAGIDANGNYNQQLYLERSAYWTSICRLTSLCFRASIPVEGVIKQLQRSTTTMVDLPSILLRVLTKFVKFDEVVCERIKSREQKGELCQSCMEHGVIQRGGCSVCLFCGDSSCG